mgnify:CR=1 FL=1
MDEIYSAISTKNTSKDLIIEKIFNTIIDY